MISKTFSKDSNENTNSTTIKEELIKSSKREHLNNIKSKNELEEEENLNEKELKYLEEIDINEEKNEQKLIKENKNNKIKEYEIIKKIGEGSYAKVYLCKKLIENNNNNNELLYAMKILDKNFLIKTQKAEEALIERKILSICNHPNIIKLISSFQTKNKLIYILEYCHNKDLEYLQKFFGIFPNNLCKKFFSEIIYVINYLHNTLNISHNDIKPSNILLDKNFHIKLIDFATAKIENKKYDKNLKKFINCNNYIDNNNMIGTSEYISPEMINKKINNYKTCDIWSLGIILYKFYHGKTPFYDDNNNKILENVLKGKIEINENLDNEVKDLLNKMLCYDDMKRIKIEDVMKHKYFKDILWENLYKEKIPLPEDLYKQFEIYLSQYNKDNNNSCSNKMKFWENFCQFNKDKIIINKEYKINLMIITEEINIIDNYYYKKENEVKNVNDTSHLNIPVYQKGKKPILIYEGIVLLIGKLKDIEVKLQLYNNKKIIMWNCEKKSFLMEIELNKNTNMILNNEIFLHINNFIFKSIKMEIIKWYQYINLVIYKEDNINNRN